MDNKYQLSRIHNYVTGLMSREEMHEMEREALEDPFLQDAIDGYKLQHGVDAARLSLLQKRLADRVAQRAVDRNRRFYGWQRLTIGMVAGVMFVVACSLIFFRYMGSRHERTNEVILMEQHFRVQFVPVGESNAVPVQGWEQFNEELNSEIRDFHGHAQLSIVLEIQNGHAGLTNISGTDDAALKKTLRNFLEHKTSWKGEKGEFGLTIKAKP